LGACTTSKYRVLSVHQLIAWLTACLMHEHLNRCQLLDAVYQRATRSTGLPSQLPNIECCLCWLRNSCDGVACLLALLIPQQLTPGGCERLLWLCIWLLGAGAAVGVLVAGVVGSVVLAVVAAAVVRLSLLGLLWQWWQVWR